MIRRLPSLLRTLGPAWVVRRLWLAIERRTGLLRRRAPAGAWSDHASAPAADVALGAGAARRIRGQPWSALPVDEAEELHRGRLRLFSGAPLEVGNPPRWHRSPLNGAEWPADRHWSLIDDASLGDVKGAWEASRWHWAHALTRAYLRDGDARHAELFWEWAEDWMRRNPPNVGVNWMCGQEAAFRLFAAAWGLGVFASSAATTPARAQSIARLAQVTGARIEAHLAYAVSQDNNHGVSEAIGLLTAGTLWPGLPQAGRWRAKGLATLGEQCDRLVAADGSFSQHSSNYHRVLLDDLCWAEAVLRSAGSTLPDNVRAAARRAAGFLHALLLPDGSVIRYGADDGARILQLSACGYQDFRPTLAACAAWFGSPGLPAGPWDEQAILLGGAPGGVTGAPAPRQLSAGGLLVRRAAGKVVALRAPAEFRFRPSHADQLHLSVHRADGSALVEDVGTLSYNDPARPWADLASARFHNVPQVDGDEPMSRVTRFLWLPWTPCVVEVDEPDRLVAAHRGFAGFLVRREVRITDDAIVVTDTLSGDREADLSVRWHARDALGLRSLAIKCDVDGATEGWHELDTATGLGCFADRYGSVAPAACRSASVRARRATFTTRIPAPSR